VLLQGDLHTGIPLQQVQKLLLWVLVCIALVLTLCAHRPDKDDCRYINRAVAMADSPTSPILQWDTRHGIPNVPVRFSSKLIANETLIGSLSLLTGVPAIYIFHWLFAGIGAFMLVLAYAGLFQILTPKHWAFATLAVMVFLCLDGALHRSYGNFSFVRLHQGKGILVSVCIPLIITYGLAYSKKPTLRNWLLLGSVQIATLGMSATGLLVSPVVSGLTLLVGFMSFKMRVRQFLIGIGSSFYILGIVCFLRISSLLRYLFSVGINSHSTNQVTQQATGQAITSGMHRHESKYFEHAVDSVFGDGNFAILCLIIVVITVFFCRNRVSKVFCVVFPVVVFLLFANPLVDRFIATIITGRVHYWRVLWLLPLPTMAALLITSTLDIKGNLLFGTSRFFNVTKMQSTLNRITKYVTFIVLMILLVVIFRHQSIFLPANLVSFGRPALKVNPGYMVSKTVVSLVEEKSFVLAPFAVSVWIPTIHHHPFPLVSRDRYATKLGNEREERMLLTQYVSGGLHLDDKLGVNKTRVFSPTKGRISKHVVDGTFSVPVQRQRLLAEGLQKYGITCVCLPTANPQREEIEEILTALDYKKSQQILGYDLWTSGP
jgi:hypothetical protein